ncbi:hypothetical protein ASF56_12310 [Methylobacterium sp. Leaf122]|nr:hypothetical protein [Methylobacterium sp. Leaf122]KQO88904.1 hypothetical protein ASF33_20040 [Methylobacterium sp. Leaf92]KQQ04524.1 hypothetical protein ASF56_12310 [Methylobacterium sp. Leaf122]
MTDSELLTLMSREAERLTAENDHSAAALMSAAADRLRGADEQMALQVRRLRPEAGDVLVLTVPSYLTRDAREHMAKMVGRAFSDWPVRPRCMILDGGADLRVVGQPAAAAEAA